MKLLSLKIIILGAVLLSAVSFAEAQVCGEFRNNIFVQDTLGKPVENAVVQFLPITKDRNARQ